MTTKVDILIDINSRLAGIQEAVRGVHQLQEETDAFAKKLELGFGIDIGERIMEGLAEVPHIFEEAVKKGVEFNQMLEQARFGIAATLQQLDKTGQFKDFNDAMVESAKTIDILKEKAKGSPAAFEDLLDGLRAILPAGFAANMTLQQQIDLITEIAGAINALGLSMDRMPTEARALLFGNITSRTQLARSLGITKADIAEATQAGTLFEFLTKKLDGLSDAADKSKNTFSVALKNLKDAIDEQLGAATEEVFEGLKQGIQGLSADISKMDKNTLREIGSEIAELVRAGFDLTHWAIENKGVLLFLAQAATVLGAAFTALKIGELVLELGSMTVAFVTNSTAIGTETFMVDANTAAWVANATARRGAAGAAATGAGAEALGETGTGGGLISSLLGAGSGAGGIALGSLSLIAAGAWWANSQLKKWDKGNQDELGGYLGDNEKTIAGLNEQMRSMQSLVQLGHARVEAESAIRDSQEKMAFFEIYGNEELTNKYQAQIAHLGTILKLLKERGAAIVAENQNEAQKQAAEEAFQNRLAALRKDAPKTDKELQAEQFKQLTPTQQKAELEKRLNDITQGQGADKYLSFAHDYVNNAKFATPEGKEAATLALKATELEILKIKDNISEVDKKIAADAQRAKEDADREARIQGEKKKLISDIAALQAEAVGKYGLASKLREENILRERAVQLQRELNLTEQEALKLAAEELQAKQQKSIRDLAVEYQIAQARANGDEARAKALEHERDIRAKTKEIMDSTGFDEKRARAIAENMERFKEQEEQRKAYEAQLKSTIGEGNHLGHAANYGQSPKPGQGRTPGGGIWAGGGIWPGISAPRHGSASATIYADGALPVPARLGATAAPAIKPPTPSGTDAEVKKATEDVEKSTQAFTAQITALVDLVKKLSQAQDDAAHQIKEMRN